MKRILSILLVFSTILCLVACGNPSYKPTHEMVQSHVFVCDNPSVKSDFDLWMMDEDGVGLDWVPSYLICTQGKVLGTIRGDISLAEFEQQYNFIISTPLSSAFADFSDYTIENLNGQRYTLSEIMPMDGNIYVLEISWMGCPDCEHQDENYTRDIYNAYDTQFFYRYYINTERSDVEALIKTN